MSENYNKTEASQKREYSAEEYRLRKKKERDGVYRLIDTTAERMKTDGELFRTFLDVQARFDRYSAANCILIAAQRPEATRLADFDTWKESGVSVNKGETGVAILGPGKEFERGDGSTGINYNVKKVFDIVQTNSKERTAPNVTRDERLILKALISDAPCELEITDNIAPTVNAVYNSGEKTIFVRAGMETPDIFRALSQELAHARMDKGGGYSRNEHQGVAYFASYILCRRFGISTDVYNFSRMPSQYANMDAKTFRAELGRIRDTANEISRDIDRFLKSPAKEKKERDDGAR